MLVIFNKNQESIILLSIAFFGLLLLQFSAHAGQPRLLFDGELTDQWLELATSGGNYSKFAQIKNKALVVNIPAGNSWGKTGIRSANELFRFPDKSKQEAIKLTFNIDAQESSDFVYAIIGSNWDGNLEWRSHLIRLQVNKNMDGKTATLSLRIRTSEKMKTTVDIENISQLSFIIRSDRIVKIIDANNNILLEAVIQDNIDVYEHGYKISTLTHANESGLPAKLKLDKISLETVEFTKEADTSILANSTGNSILFDGKQMGHRWIRYIEAKTEYEKVAKLANNSLQIDIPDKTGNANVGIESNKPIIWLDGFGEGSKREVIFDFVPTDTTGFAIVLSHKGNHFIVKWVKDTATDSAIIQIYLSTNLGLIGNWNSSYTPVWEQKVSANPPAFVTLTLTPKGILLSGDNLPEHLQTWEFLKANAGYKIYAYSFPLLPDKAVKMALKQISLNTTKLVPLEQPKVDEYVKPLPIKTFFDGSKVKDWVLTPWHIYKKPIESCHLDASGFSVFDVPEGTPLDGCDIHTAETIAELDERINDTSYIVTAEFDSTSTKNFQVVVTPHIRSKWNKYYEACYVQLFQNNKSENIFSLNCGGDKNYWQRLVSKKWLESDWDGKLTITIGKEWLQAQLGNEQTIQIAHKPPAHIYVYIVAIDYHHAGTKTAFMLKKLTGQWQAPKGMKSVERWYYIDKSDFDPEQFIKDLANDLPNPNVQMNLGDEDEQ